MVRSRVSRKVAAQVAGGALALMIGLGFASNAMAIDTVRTTVTGGALTATIANLNLGNVPYSHANVDKSGTMILTVDDRRGTGAGWNVTVLAGDFVYDDTHPGGLDIPAANFHLDGADTPVLVSGQVPDVNGPRVPAPGTVDGTLDTPRKVVESMAGSGMGRYTQDLDVTLTVPGNSMVGTYTSLLTVTESAAP